MMRACGFVLLCFATHAVFAEGPAPAQKATPTTEKTTETPPNAASKKTTRNSAPQVLDFDSDVIEGERKSPDLFLQLHVDTPNLDTLLYQRRNFNDFHAVEKNRRPHYRKVSP